MGERDVSDAHARALDDSGTEPDVILVKRAREGDEHAFELLFTRYHRELGAFIRSRVGNAQEAEDITSDVFMKVIRFLDGYRTGSFRGWLYQIARNTVVDHYRGYRETASLNVVSNIVSPIPALDEQAIANEARAELIEALATLPPVPRRILELRFKGYGLADICADLGMELSAVKSAQHRAYKRMRMLLHDSVNGQGGNPV